MGKHDDQWDLYVADALGILRTRKNAATKLTPAMALLGYELPGSDDWNTSFYKTERRYHKQLAQNDRIQIIRANQSRFQSRYINSDQRPGITFGEGDFVMVREFRPLKESFAPVWAGPFKITQKKSDLVYNVSREGKITTFHVNDLRPAPLGNQLDTYSSDTDTETEIDDSSQSSTSFDSDDSELDHDQILNSLPPPGLIRNSPNSPGSSSDIDMSQNNQNQCLGASTCILSNNSQSLVHSDTGLPVIDLEGPISGNSTKSSPPIISSKEHAHLEHNAPYNPTPITTHSQTLPRPKRQLKAKVCYCCNTSTPPNFTPRA